MLKINQFVFNPFQENTYLLHNEAGECIIIDPGCYHPQEKEQLVDFIEKNRLEPKMLLNTHCHLDHIFGNAFMADKYGLKLYMHPLDKIVLDGAAGAGLMFDLPCEVYTGEIVYIEEGASFGLGNDFFQVLFTPGHSPGSISFYNKEQHLLIAGDVLFNRSIGRTDLPGGNYETLIQSIREKLFVLPPETVVYSGHGPSTTIGEEMSENPFLN